MQSEYVSHGRNFGSRALDTEGDRGRKGSAAIPVVRSESKRELPENLVGNVYSDVIKINSSLC